MSLKRSMSRNYPSGKFKSRMGSAMGSTVGRNTNTSGDWDGMGFNNSFYGTIQSVEEDGSSISGATSMIKSTMLKSKTPSIYRAKSQKLLANAIFADGKVNSIKQRAHDDLFDSDEEEKIEVVGNGNPKKASSGRVDHDEDVDDWY